MVDQELFVEHVVHELGLGTRHRVPSRWTPEELDLSDVALVDLPRLTRTEGSVEPAALTGPRPLPRRSSGRFEPDEDGSADQVVHHVHPGRRHCSGKMPGPVRINGDAISADPVAIVRIRLQCRLKMTIRF
jgi:hypothetical protein